MVLQTSSCANAFDTPLCIAKCKALEICSCGLTGFVDFVHSEVTHIFFCVSTLNSCFQRLCWVSQHESVRLNEGSGEKINVPDNQIPNFCLGEPGRHLHFSLVPLLELYFLQQAVKVLVKLALPLDFIPLILATHSVDSPTSL